MIENSSYLKGTTSLSFPVKGPKGKPLTTTDDIAVRILIDEKEDTYDGYVSLTELLRELVLSVKGSETNTEEIDTLPEVYLFLSEFKNNQTLKEVASEVNEASEEDIDHLFTQDQNLEEGLS